MPVREGVCPTLLGVVCSYIFLFALKGALQELKLYGTPSLAEVHCDNTFQVSTILILCCTEQAVRYRYSLLPCKYCEIWNSQCVDFMGSFLCCYAEEHDWHVGTFRMKSLQPFSGLWQTTLNQNIVNFRNFFISVVSGLWDLVLKLLPIGAQIFQKKTRGAI